MKRTNRIKWGEIKVGVLVVFALAILLWVSFSGEGTSIFDSKVSYRAYFTNVNGLVSGAPVWISGVEIGNVTLIKFVNLDSVRQIEIKIRVKKEICNMITTNAAVKLGNIGFLGDKYVEIIPGTLTLPQLEPGGTIQTISSADAVAMISEGQKAMSSARKLSDNLTELTGQLKRGEGTAGKLFANDTLYYEMTKLVTSLTSLVKDLQQNQERLISSVEKASKNLADITGQINSKTGTAGKFISDPALYDNLRSSTGRIDSILARVERGEGSAGALVRDDSLYQEVKHLIIRVESLVSDIEKNPRKYFKFSVF
ncbi:MAG: MlaD family protein [candidate division Zixibacteria bacterium]|nr:MlaD family protein [candidate division Zixibacteria bacterium]